jgi:hypothetical protein
MKSNRERRAELKEERAAKRARKARSDAEWAARSRVGYAQVDISVNTSLLGSYGLPPEFVRRGYYMDIPFRCKDCNKDEIWTATQQKWWYEVAKGKVYTTAVRCRACRRVHRAKRELGRATQARRAARKDART